MVLASPRGEPQPGGSYPLDAVTTMGRDVNNGIVLDDPFASSDHAVLTYRGRTWYVEDLDEHQRHVRQRRPGRGRRTARVRRRAPGRRDPVPARPGPRVSAVAQARPGRRRSGSTPGRARRSSACSASSRSRWWSGAASLGATQRFRATVDAGGRPPTSLDFSPPDRARLLVYLAALLIVHLAFVLAGRRTDQVLLPAVAMLGGIGLLLMQRLPQDTVVQSFGDARARARPAPARLAAHRARR